MAAASELLGLRRYVKELRRAGRAQPLVEVMQRTWNAGKNVRDFVHSRTALAGFQDATRGKNYTELVDVVLNGFGRVLAPIQSPNELARWIQRVSVAKPKVVVEIGTAKGGTFFLLSRASDQAATLISIDLPGGLYGGGYPLWKQDFFRKLIGAEKTVHFIRANSHDLQTRTQLEAILGDRKIDVLFIDGDHSYEGVRHDFWLYGPLVRPGGLIGLHDILENRFDKDIDVSRFWNEIKGRFVVEEIVDRADQGVFGIGVVIVPEAGVSGGNGERHSVARERRGPSN